MTDPAEELFAFGRVVGQHGLRGDLRVRPLTDGSDALCVASAVFLRDASGTIQRLEPVRTVMHKGQVLLRLKGFEEINRAAVFVGCEVLMRFDELPELDENEHYWHQLQGLEVVDRKHGHLGTLDEMFTTAAHDIYVVHGPFGEVLIPAVAAMILAVDPVAGRIEVDLPEGLVSQSDED